MSNERPIKSFKKPDGKRRVLILTRADGLYHFEEQSYVNKHGDEFWQASHWSSGLYESADEAERDAMATIPWLRDCSSN